MEENVAVETIESNAVIEKKDTINKVPRGFIPAWSSRSVSVAVNVVLFMQMTFYATDVVGLSAGLVGTLILLSKIVEALSNFLVVFIDRTHTKFGKARPYELFIIPLWILTIMLFSTPNWGMTGKAIYVFILYTLVDCFCITFLTGSDIIYLGRSLKGDVRRAKVLSGSGIIVTLFAAAIGILLPILMGTWGKQPGGWTKISLVLGVPFLIIGLIRFLFIKEIEEGRDAEQQQQIPFKVAFKAMIKNKYILILAGAIFVQFVSGGMSAFSTYYFNSIVGNLSMLSVIGIIGIISPFVLLFFPLAMRKIGAMNFVRGGIVLMVIGNGLKYFAGNNIGLLLVENFIAAVGIIPLTMMVGIFTLQCMDYGEWKTGVRVESGLNAIVNFTNKIGTGLGSGLVGLIMGISGYVGTAHVQTASAKTAIVWGYSLIPALLSVLMLVILHFYDLDKKIVGIQEEIAARKAK
ncbi:MFS transporter [Neobacillus vireti]|uniref:MFS transporter n=1 Tax=Neobacillus vireti TaxID=220686 RepID=UPI002FFF642B